MVLSLHLNPDFDNSSPFGITSAATVPVIFGADGISRSGLTSFFARDRSLSCNDVS